jgi:hypothetical protein
MGKSLFLSGLVEWGLQGVIHVECVPEMVVCAG